MHNQAAMIALLGLMAAAIGAALMVVLLFDYLGLWGFVLLIMLAVFLVATDSEDPNEGRCS